MKKVLLLGDSIRGGYDDWVRECLAGEAEVLYSKDSGRFLQYTLRQLQEWKAELKITDDLDVVHWNNGLWDVGHLGIGATGETEALTAAGTVGKIVSGKYVYEEENLTPPDIYEYMLVRVARRIGTLFPRAKIIFAYTTPMIGTSPAFLYRSNEEICQYNAIAKRALEPFGVIFNDLYTFADEKVRDYHRDWVHYDETGCRLLAQKVSDAIRECF